MLDNEKSYFDGGLLQWIGWNILGAIVTVCTLGICYPWALCMVYGWKINHTVVDGRRLKSTVRGKFGTLILKILLIICTMSKAI